MLRFTAAKAEVATIRPRGRNTGWQRRLRRLIGVVGASALTLGTFGVVLGTPDIAGANPVTTVWVNHSGDAGWSAGQVCYTATYLSIVPTVTSDTVTFRTGPGTTPDGEGSVQIATGNGSTGGTCNSAIRSSSYSGLKLATLTSLSYWSYSSINNGQQFPFLELNVNYGEGGTTADDTLFFEPPLPDPDNRECFLPQPGRHGHDNLAGLDSAARLLVVELGELREPGDRRRAAQRPADRSPRRLHRQRKPVLHHSDDTRRHPERARGRTRRRGR